METRLTRRERLRVSFQVGLSLCLIQMGIQASQSPFTGTPWSIPGAIEVENFDEGGEGISYHDTTAANEGGAYRNTAVDIYASADASGGYYVQLRQGEWLEFTVNVQETALYDVFARVLLDSPGGEQFRLLLDDREVAGPFTLPGIGGPPAWDKTSTQGVVLQAGQHVLRLYLSHVIYPQFNQSVSFDNLRFVSSTLVPQQVISGGGQPGFADGPPDQAQYSTNITGLDVDPAGNIYVADSGNYRVRKVSPGGDVMTLAGNGTAGTANGPGDQAQFSILRGVAVDDLGNCYVTDGSSSDGSNKIRKISSDRQVSTLYSAARGFTDFASIALNISGEVHFITSSASGFPPLYTDTISKLSPLGSKVDVLTIHGTGASGTFLEALSSGHSSNSYYIGENYDIGARGWAVDRLEANGGRSELYAVGPNPPFSIHGLVADRSNNIYFGIGSDLVKLPRAGGSLSVHTSSRMSDALATDSSGNIYGFENNRLIKLLMNSGGVCLTAFTDGGGVVTLDPHGPFYTTNSVVHVDAAAWAGWTFLGWTEHEFRPCGGGDEFHHIITALFSIAKICLGRVGPGWRWWNGQPESRSGGILPRHPCGRSRPSRHRLCISGLARWCPR